MSGDRAGKLFSNEPQTGMAYFPAEVLALDTDGEPLFAQAWISEFTTARAAMSCDQYLQPGQRIDLRILCSGRTIPPMFQPEEPLGDVPVVIRAQAEVIAPLDRGEAVFSYLMTIRFLGHFSIVQSKEPAHGS